MRLLVRIAASSALLMLASTQLTFAADYDPPIIMDSAPNIVPVEIGTGWYLRGDVGYALGTKADGDFSYRMSGISETFDTARVSKDFSFGLGFGYSFNDWLRADVTLDRLTTSFSGEPGAPSPCGATSCASELTAYSGLINAYADLGTFVGFTPYVGAGVGYTYAKWDDLTGGAGGSPVAGDSDWRFTYALMAGVAYDVTKNMKVDVGYRYRDIDGGNMYAAASAAGPEGSDPGLTSHELRVGLRYELW